MLARAERKNHGPRIAELTAKLAVPPFPPALHYVWKAFWRLRGRTQPGMSGPGRITWPDIDAFMRATRLRLSPWEIELIEALDDLYLTTDAEARERERDPSNAPANDAEASRTILFRGVQRRPVQSQRRSTA